MIESIDCAGVQFALQDYEANMLPVHEKLQIAHHISGCSVCSNLVEEMRNKSIRFDDPHIHVAKHYTTSH